MQTSPSEKTVIVALGVALGAGIALAISNRNRAKTAIIYHPVKLDFIPAPVSRAPVSRQLEQRRTEWKPVIPALPELPGLVTKSEPVSTAKKPEPAPSQRNGIENAIVHASILVIAFGLFIALFESVRSDGRIQAYEMAMLSASCMLIASFYGFLCRLTGCGSAGRAWIRLRPAGDILSEYAARPFNHAH